MKTKLIIWIVLMVLGVSCSEDAPTHAECEKLHKAKESARITYSKYPNSDTRKAYEGAQRAYNDKCK